MVDRRPRVVLLSPNSADLDLLHQQLGPHWQVLPFEDPAAALDTIRSIEVAVVVAEHDLEGLSGVDWLLDVRAEDPEAILVLLASHAHGLDVAVDALNRAGVTKLIARPWEVDELLVDMEEAVASHRRDISRTRSFALSSARVRRMEHDQDRLLTLLDVQARRLGELGERLDAWARSEPREEALPAERMLGILADLVRPHAAAAVAQGERVARLAVSCGERLGWGRDELHVLALAAKAHALTGPWGADRATLDGKTLRTEASRLGRLLATVPSLAEVGNLVAVHEEPCPLDGTDRVPRAARLLQILALFEGLRFPTSSEPSASDPVFLLAKATDVVLRTAGRRLDPELTRTVMLEVLPVVFGRDEGFVLRTNLRPGMTLSRPILVAQLPFLHAGTVLTAESLARVGTVSDTAQNTGAQIPGAWIRGTDLRDRAA